MQEVPLALASTSRDDKYVEVGVCLLNRKFAESLSLIIGFDKFECNSWISQMRGSLKFLYSIR